MRWGKNERIFSLKEKGQENYFFKTSVSENKMAEELVAVEYISSAWIHQDTPSDTEVYAEHQLRADRRT